MRSTKLRYIRLTHRKKHGVEASNCCSTDIERQIASTASNFFSLLRGRQSFSEAVMEVISLATAPMQCIRVLAQGEKQLTQPLPVRIRRYKSNRGLKLMRMPIYDMILRILAPGGTWWKTLDLYVLRTTPWPRLAALTHKPARHARGLGWGEAVISGGKI
ncbi:hypothetical protein BJX99DRAFT_234849 [Aspergillus californicus]